MINRKITFSVIVLMLTSSLAFCQSEALKNAVNNLASYKKNQDLKFLSVARKTVDSLIKTRKDSADLQKNIYKTIIYTAILYNDPINKLGNPPTFLRTTTEHYDNLARQRKIYKYQTEMNFAARCLANTYIRYGFLHMEKGKDYTNALASFKMAQKYAPSFKQLNAYIAYANGRLGNIQEAARYYTILLNTDTIRAEYVEAAANTYRSVGDTARALQVLQKGRKLLPNDRTLLLEEANIYNNKKDYKALEPLLPQLLDGNPNNADIAFIAANCYDRLDKFEQAESLYLRTIDLNEVFYEPVFNLGVLYLRSSAIKKDSTATKDLVRAGQWLEKANEISPYDAKCLNLLQIVYTKQGNRSQLDKVNNKLKQLTN
ncbi:tetratricopeptide repeat protein [Mucilaginibacter myungsuensis]|uniref:Tetratricopeptide repeat protein n=1 Tax=Mucilaginibacter myungsuensis TaxID=649104 RepID=A0A929KWT6_9SPHI|nr:hypothetical protein [Mucilaginibacter myungsuensis]MBE9660359.1 hypothetical protein [Mucilaginibacter myungsuensis]MDN3600401.1 hypothetical protein [Mucilaginibacter myungsuensis]